MLSENESKVLASVEETRVVRLCRDLVRIPTVNPYSGDKNPAGEKAGHDFMVKLFTDMGAVVQRIPCDDAAFDKYSILATKGRINEGRDNTIAIFTLGSGNGPTILLDAHMDTVAVDHFDGNPFSADLKDGKIFGRGTSDDKGGVAAVVEAVRAILANPDGLDGKIVCCIVSEEESDGAGRGSISCVSHLPRPDFALLVDGGYDFVQDGCTGVITARITVHGKAGHAAGKNSLNAIEQAFKLNPAFEKFKALRGNLPGAFNFGLFQAGDHPANVPSVATLAFNIKTSFEDMKAAKEKYGLDNGRLVRELFEKCVNEVVSADETLRENPPTLVWTKDMPAIQASSVDADFVKFCDAVYRDATGSIPAVAPMYGWGDLAHFLRAGIPTVGIGAGALGKSHSADEYVEVEALVGISKVAALAIARKLKK